ncbi:MAG: leucine-rich repeat domain-containing protein, partial [Anaeroplasmataceae bacterium]|nr:leucine-rich repeat domain-containing protein [Anaeroplasmataceae bacterium]
MFSNCPALEDVTVAECVEVIDYAAFEYCVNLTRLVLPFIGKQRGNDYSEEALFGWIFGFVVEEEESTVVTLDLEEDLDSDMAQNHMVGFLQEFRESATATELTERITLIPSSLSYVEITDETIVGSGAFSHLTIETINLNNTITEIGDYAFYQSGVVYSNPVDKYNISLPEDTKKIRQHAYDGAYELVSLKTNPNLNKVIDDDPELENLVPIEPYAFANEEKLCDVLFENNYIGEYMFANDTALVDLVVADCVETIEKGFLFKTTALETLSVPFIGLDKDANESESSVLGWFFQDDASEITDDEKALMTIVEQEYNEGEFTTNYIPNSLHKITITNAKQLGYGALDQMTMLDEIYLNCNLELIDDYAIRNTSIRNIDVPSSVVTIDKGAFKDNQKLKSVRFVGGTGLESIADETFMNCPKLLMTSVPDSVTYIGQQAFYGDSSFTKFKIPESVTYIGNAAVGGCINLTEIEIPFVGAHVYTETYEEIRNEETRYAHDSEETLFGWIFGHDEFAGTYTARQAYNDVDFEKLNDNPDAVEANRIPSSLTKVILTSGIGIGYGAFMNCSKLKEIILPKELKFIGKYAFYGCWDLAGIDIPEGVDIIGSGAFANTGIEYIEIRNPIVADQQFANCKKLHTVIAYDTVEEIGNGAFTGCSLLENLTLPFVGRRNYTDDTKNAGYDTSFVWIFGKDASINANLQEFEHVHKPEYGKTLDYQSSEDEVFIIPVNTKEEERAKFTETIQYFVDHNRDGNYTTEDYCSGYVPNSLISITITNQKIFAKGSMMNIANNINAEGNHPRVEKIKLTLPTNGTLVEIGDRTFEGATSFHEISMPDSVEVIGARSFACNEDLTTVRISENSNCTKIGDEAFLYDANLLMTTLPDNITEIGKRSFVGCDSITEFNTNKVQIIGESAFEGGKLEELTLTDSLEEIKDKAFKNNDSLTTVTIPQNANTLGKETFADCDGLTGFELNNTLIGERMFADCDGLVSITIPENIIKVDPYAFANCTNLGTGYNEEDQTGLAVTFLNNYIGDHM